MVVVTSACNAAFCVQTRLTCGRCRARFALHALYYGAFLIVFESTGVWAFHLVSTNHVDAVSKSILLDCSDRRSCVSSVASDPRRRIKALVYYGDTSQALDRLAKIVENLPGGAAVERTDCTFQATFTSRVFGFVDDVDFVVSGVNHIDVRSRSRLGYYDFGVNRARIEKIRAQFSTVGST